MSRVEIRKDIRGFEGLYQVSNTGKVKSCNRITICSDNKRHSVKERILKQTQNNKAEVQDADARRANRRAQYIEEDR